MRCRTIKEASPAGTARDISPPTLHSTRSGAGRPSGRVRSSDASVEFGGGTSFVNVALLGTVKSSAMVVLPEFKFLRFPRRTLLSPPAIVLHGRAQKAHLNYGAGCSFCPSSSFLHRGRASLPSCAQGQQRR